MGREDGDAAAEDRVVGGSGRRGVGLLRGRGRVRAVVVVGQRWSLGAWAALWSLLKVESLVVEFLRDWLILIVRIGIAGER